MPNRITDLLNQIKTLEDQVSDELIQRKQQARYHLDGKRVELEQLVSQKHRALKKSVVHTLFVDRPQNLITAPIIYGMAIPLVLFDVLITFYQYSCFPIYGINRVKRKHYFIYDRSQLQYLNIIQKVNCQYCAYGNGLMGYATEVLARTEQYFCPIKHAEKRVGAHQHYQAFSEFGDAEHFQQDIKRLRKALRKDETEA